jgi:hypothetical protein
MGSVTTWQDLLRPGDATDFFSRRTFPPFDPAATEYSAANALWLAELSRLVYRHDVEEDDPPPCPPRSRFLEKAGLHQRRFFRDLRTSTQAMVVESGGPSPFAVLAFRGTEQRFKDFVTDLKVGVEPLLQKSVGVHQGFREALDSVWAAIEAALLPLSCPVFYAGHSLGAALATLAAARRAPQAVYTFGSPLVGNEAFAASLSHVPIHRVVDDWDIVTRLPPPALGFRHVGGLRLLREPPRFSLDPRFWLRRFMGPRKHLADHAPVHYVDRIGRQPE